MSFFQWLADASLEKAVASLSEGYCPNCQERLTQQVPFDLEGHEENHLEDGSHPGAFAQGGCKTCGHWLRAGASGSDPDRDWFSAQMIHPRGFGLITMSLNPPSEDKDYDEEEEW